MKLGKGKVQGISGLFHSLKPLIGVIHLPPLVGGPRAELSLPQITERALSDAHALIDNGIDGIIVENYGDVPFFPDSVEPHTVAAMSLIVAQVKSVARDSGLPVGVNVLRNDAKSALAIATVTGADFIRVNVHIGAMVTDQGLIEGKAYETLRYQEKLASDVKILADVLVKHAAPLGVVNLEMAAKDTYYRGLADALIITGAATGSEVNTDDVRRVKTAVPEAMVFVGSGVTEENLENVLRYADGIIVGTALKKNGKTSNEVDSTRVEQIVKEKRRFADTKDT